MIYFIFLIFTLFTVKMAAERQREGDNNFIKDLKLYQETFSIKVLILKVSLEQFSSSKGSGQVQKIIVIDEEVSITLQIKY